MSPTSSTPQPNGGTSPETIRQLDLADHLSRLADLLHLVAAAADSLPRPHGAAIARGTQIALDEVDAIRGMLEE
ncbi:hypothetical protein ACEPPZ_11265 [Paracoccus yeei]|uniref:hypothetical protein n=1 Tax=Paracoccus yeei TaxID=147645 RepID=UPI0037D413E3